MRINSRNMFLALALGAFALASSPSWASMMPAQQTTPGGQSAQQYQGAQPAQAQLGQKSAHSQTEAISGKLVKSGSQYVLQASNGQEYQLSGASRAKAYVGHNVTVTGKVDASSHTIQVQSISPR